MNNMRLFKKSLLAVTVTLATQQAFAAGFQLNAQSATGLGRAFAGDAVIADNAAVMSRNPAAMALFDEMALSLGFETITTMIDVKNVSYRGVLGNSVSVQDTDDVGGTSVAPNIHLIVPVNEQFAWGVNAYSNFGTKTEFSDSYPASEYGGLTDVKSFNLGLAGSYRVNKEWSFGAGLDLIYGQGTMKRIAGTSFPASTIVVNPTTVIPARGTSLLNVDKADGWAVGFNLGTVYEMDENNRMRITALVCLTAIAQNLKLKTITDKRSRYHYRISLSSLASTKLRILSLPYTIAYSGLAGVLSTKLSSATL